jgi:hypothetical protein
VNLRVPSAATTWCWEYLSYGSIIAGSNNASRNHHTTNLGQDSSINGGCFNLAGFGTVGRLRIACTTAGYYPEISGGEGNEADAVGSTVSRGNGNLAGGAPLRPGR